MRILGGLIALALVGVVIAPILLSAQDILEWAQHNTVESGLGLTKVWAWVSFLALDLAAAVCVLISLYCAIRNWKAGFFAFGVWVFAGATAFANYQFGSRPGAPGDAAWFFPAMSILGPVMLHATLKFLRKVIRAGAGAVRASRPVFPLLDWMPVIGAPQDTYGAWKTGGLLGIEKPDRALWAYRVVSLNAGWWRRWSVKHLVRMHQVAEMRARLADETLALAIPGLLPDDAFVALADPASAPAVDPAPTGRTALPAPAGQRGAALTNQQGALAGAPIASQGSAAVQGTGERTALTQGNPAGIAGNSAGASATSGVASAPVQGDPQGALPDAQIINLAENVRQSARSALLAIFEAHGDRYGSWAELAAPSTQGGVSLNGIETGLKIGKRRARAALAVAEHVLPWGEAPAAVVEWRERQDGQATG
jgi:hypothetical protein